MLARGVSPADWSHRQTWAWLRPKVPGGLFVLAGPVPGADAPGQH